MNQYFDYDDYLEFLQLFTRVIYEKLTGEEVEAKPTDAQSQGSGEQTAGLVENRQVQEQPKEPAKILTMKVKDAQGRVNTYQQKETEQTDALDAFEYMTAGGQNRMAIFLSKTV